MSLITSKESFKSVMTTIEGREMEIQEWMDGRSLVEGHGNEDSVFCFVVGIDFRNVNLLRFGSTDDMDVEMGDLTKEFSDGERVYYPTLV